MILRDRSGLALAEVLMSFDQDMQMKVRMSYQASRWAQNPLRSERNSAARTKEVKETI